MKLSKRRSQQWSLWLKAGSTRRSKFRLKSLLVCKIETPSATVSIMNQLIV